MLGKVRQLRKEIKNYGFSHFTKMKRAEHFYKKKFSKLSVYYPHRASDSNVVSKLSVNQDSKANQATGYYWLRKGFDITGLRYSDISMLDIGCGFGRAVHLGMLHGFKSVIGFDLEASVIDKALDNCIQMQKQGFKTPFNVHQADAYKYQIPEGVNVIFMSNPFGEKTMEHVVKNIMQYQHNNKKELYIIYYVPVCQHVFAAYKDCIKIYESFNGDKSKSGLVVFKINAI